MDKDGRVRELFNDQVNSRFCSNIVRSIVDRKNRGQIIILSNGILIEN